MGSGDPPHLAVRLSFSSVSGIQDERERGVLMTIAQRVVIKFLTN